MLGQSRSGGAALYSPGTLLNNGRYKIEKRLNSECLSAGWPSARSCSERMNQPAAGVPQPGGSRLALFSDTATALSVGRVHYATVYTTLPVVYWHASSSAYLLGCWAMHSLAGCAQAAVVC
jgi:hypothetical protein